MTIKGELHFTALGSSHNSTAQRKTADTLILSVMNSRLKKH